MSQETVWLIANWEKIIEVGEFRSGEVTVY